MMDAQGSNGGPDGSIMHAGGGVVYCIGGGGGGGIGRSSHSESMSVAEVLKQAEDALHAQLGDLEKLRCALSPAMLKMPRHEARSILRWL